MIAAVGPPSILMEAQECRDTVLY